PLALASRCAFSKLPQPRPVEDLSVCKVATGTPVASEILSRLAARDGAIPNIRMNAAMITVKPFIYTPPFRRFRFWHGLRSPCASEYLSPAQPKVDPDL